MKKNTLENKNANNVFLKKYLNKVMRVLLC